LGLLSLVGKSYSARLIESSIFDVEDGNIVVSETMGVICNG
jgi:ABC-type methionine transport system permease subunit